MYASSCYFSNAGQVKLIGFIFHVLLKKNTAGKAVLKDHYAKVSAKISGIHYYVGHACKTALALYFDCVNASLDGLGGTAVF